MYKSQYRYQIHIYWIQMKTKFEKGKSISKKIYFNQFNYIEDLVRHISNDKVAKNEGNLSILKY